MILIIVYCDGNIIIDVNNFCIDGFYLDLLSKVIILGFLILLIVFIDDVMVLGVFFFIF